MAPALIGGNPHSEDFGCHPGANFRTLVYMPTKFGSEKMPTRAKKGPHQEAWLES